jgi:hypothetical protein
LIWLPRCASEDPGFFPLCYATGGHDPEWLSSLEFRTYARRYLVQLFGDMVTYLAKIAVKRLLRGLTEYVTFIPKVSCLLAYIKLHFVR